eukprot:CAMPEP_0119014014 /NCGR_PEP_ID=MMETSP1176-20130426/9307_1 /TAXON_ID=265551 /ORGANISM="Synedropsis recta cf, Strain CCMP1620" /LENGTH=957 /DNA_ID=CAMNT_0006967147 /DNA_START=13 /DNA_END=2886 /DNA_ORIENTATION=-
MAMMIMGASSVSAVDMFPDTGTCWTSNRDILLSEVKMIFNAKLYSLERTYFMCPTALKIGTFDVAAFAAGGKLEAIDGDLPLIVINPNFSLMCDGMPGTCEFEGGQTQLMSLVEENLDFVQALVSLVFPTATVPEDYALDTTNMVIVGITFTGSNGDLEDSEAAVMQLDSPGLTMQMAVCTFKDNGLTTSSYSAIKLSGATDPRPFGYADLSIFQTVFENSIFSHAVISHLGRGPPPPGEYVPLFMVLESCEINGNHITGIRNGDGATYPRASLLTSYDSFSVIRNTNFMGNTIETGFAPVVLIQARISTRVQNPNPWFFDVSDTVITEDTSLACHDVQKLFISGVDSSGFVYTSDGCIEYGTKPTTIMQPPSGDCWDSTFAILQSELPAIYDNALASTERVYTMCNKTYVIGTLDDLSDPLPEGIDYPIVPFVPNVVIRCLGECIFTGESEHIKNLVDNASLEAFLKQDSQGLLTLPVGFMVDSTNFRAEGITFSGASNSCADCYTSPVKFLGRGNNMQFVGCTWTGLNTVSAVQTTYLSNPGVKAGEEFYNSLRLTDCIIQDSSFQFAAVSTGFTGDMPSALVMKILLKGTTIKNNTILSVDLDTSAALPRAALLATFFTLVVVKESEMLDNTIVQGSSPFVLINSGLVPEKVVFSENVIMDDLSAECEDATYFGLSGGVNPETGISDPLVFNPAGCEEFAVTPLGFPCFSGSSTLEVLDVGKVALRDVKIGQKVLVSENRYEQVYSFGHFNQDTVAKFLQIKTVEDATLEVSAEHMVFVEDRGAIPAALISVGDKLMTPNAQSSVTVETIKDITSRGVFAPFTPSGKVVVDGILASSFVALGEASPVVAFLGIEFSHHWVAHSFEFPHRVVCHYLKSCPIESYTEEGISTWVAHPKEVGLWLLDQNFLVRGIIGSIFVGILAVFNVMEMMLFHPAVLMGGLFFVWKLRAGGKKV